MDWKYKILTRLIAMMLSFLLLFPAGIMAEEAINNSDQAVTIETQAGIDQVTNEMTPQPGESASAITSLAEVPDISSSDNLAQQVVVVYAEAGEANVEDLALTTAEVVSGDQVSNRVDVLNVSDATNVDQFIAELEKNPNVLAVDKNEKIEVTALPNDPYITNGSAWHFERIGADQTWDKIANSEPVVVAVIDTGLNVNHPDLIGNTVYGYDFVRNQVDVVDVAGHGTEVSGCIAAVTNNGIGTAGVSGLANIKIAPYRVGGTYDGDTQLDVAYICAAILKAAERPEVKVINMSFGGYGTFPTLEAAVNEAINAGKVVVASAGNEGQSGNARAGQYAYPASYERVISVAATTTDNTRASFSQYNNRVDLCAPGQGIITATRTGGYISANGTSFSSPIVAGACSVIMAADSSLNPAAVETVLKNTAWDLGSGGTDPYYGSGMIQLDNAVASLTAAETVASTYRTHVQNVGWQGWKNDGEISGTSGQSLRLEGIEIKMNTAGQNVGVEYQTHVQNIGWQGFRSDGQTSGTYGKSLRLEAIQIRLTGADADQYDIYYQVHCQNYGWLDWAKNGESAGSEGLSLRLEAIEIKVLPKGSPAPGSTARPFIK